MYTVKHKSAQVRPDESTPESPQALNAEAVVSDMEVRCLRVGFFVWNRLTSLTMKQNQAHLVAYSDLIVLVLEVLNAIFSKNLAGNADLVYSLLHEQEFLSHFRTYVKFSALIENMDTVATHFQARIQEAGLEGSGYNEIRQLIQRESKVWPASKMKASPQRSFLPPMLQQL